MSAFQIKRVLRGILAHVAFTGRRHKPGHAVLGVLGVQFSIRRLVGHAFGQQWHQLARVGFQHADFDNVVLQQTLGKVQDV